MPKETLVVFWSMNGSSKEVAIETARFLDADLEELVDTTNWRGLSGFVNRGSTSVKKGCSKNVQPTKYDPQNYKNIVIISPLWAAAVSPTVRTYLVNNKPALKSIWLIVTLGFSKTAKSIKELSDMGIKVNGALGINTGINPNNPKLGDYKPRLHEFLSNIPR